MYVYPLTELIIQEAYIAVPVWTHEWEDYEDAYLAVLYARFNPQQ